VKVTLAEFLRNSNFSRERVLKEGVKRAERLLAPIHPYLQKDDKIIDVGTGVCAVSQHLINQGYDVTPLDVVDLSFSSQIKPRIYDGITIPFEDNTFNVALIITTLHHTPDPEVILNEAKRVSRRVIVVEDIYDNKFQEFITKFFDSLFNLEFKGHPHTNRADVEWQETFERVGLKLQGTYYQRAYGVFNLGTYILDK
jgi:SAM-dependent methyltransferase